MKFPKITQQFFEDKLLPVIVMTYGSIFLTLMLYNIYIIKSEKLFKLLPLECILGGILLVIICVYISEHLPDENAEKKAKEYAEYQKLLSELHGGQ